MYLSDCTQMYHFFNFVSLAVVAALQTGPSLPPQHPDDLPLVEHVQHLRSFIEQVLIDVPYFCYTQGMSICCTQARESTTTGEMVMLDELKFERRVQDVVSHPSIIALVIDHNSIAVCMMSIAVSLLPDSDAEGGDDRGHCPAQRAYPWPRSVCLKPSLAARLSGA
eukprot:TRINITY_DN13083_c0_g1_i1.p1 TRINITY_DN13083_c0_g1~~TRINITY_DN13083_c0_g1_i1.p1  ORF type:complete len:166 (-),score=6.94 TRINITY_DN13083_c0_g1_i1:127-624(-)